MTCVVLRTTPPPRAVPRRSRAPPSRLRGASVPRSALLEPASRAGGGRRRAPSEVVLVDRGVRGAAGGRGDLLERAHVGVRAQRDPDDLHRPAGSTSALSVSAGVQADGVGVLVLAVGDDDDAVDGARVVVRPRGPDGGQRGVVEAGAARRQAATGSSPAASGRTSRCGRPPASAASVRVGTSSAQSASPSSFRANAQIPMAALSGNSASALFAASRARVARVRVADRGPHRRRDVEHRQQPRRLGQARQPREQRPDLGGVQGQRRRVRPAGCRSARPRRGRLPPLPRNPASADRGLRPADVSARDDGVAAPSPAGRTARPRAAPGSRARVPSAG